MRGDQMNSTIIGDVDTHAATHQVSVIDTNGRFLATESFAANPVGYAAALRWMQSRGSITAVGVEGTGTYGAGLTRHLQHRQIRVLEVPRPDRRLRRSQGKS